MRRALSAALLAVACAAACNPSPTTITVRVDVPTGPPVTASYLAVTLTPLEDGGGRFIYDISSLPVIGAIGHTLVVILREDQAVTFDVGVAALAAPPADGADGGDDGGTPIAVPVSAGAASVTTIAHRDVDVTVHLAPLTGSDGGIPDADDAAATD